MDILSLLRALPQAIFMPEFFMVCVLVFFICEALFKIPQLNDMGWGKPVTALVVGMLLSVFVAGPSPDAVLVGFMAGAMTTLTVNRLDWWFARKKK